MSNNPELNEYLRRVLEGLQQQREQNQEAPPVPAAVAGEAERIRALLAQVQTAFPLHGSALGNPLLTMPSLGGVDPLTSRLLMERLAVLEANAALAGQVRFMMGDAGFYLLILNLMQVYVLCFALL